MIKKVFILLSFWAVFMSIGSAQTIQWLVKPQYDSISYLSASVFKCYDGNRVQLVNTRGRCLFTPAADSVTKISEQWALVLDKKDEGLMVRGIVDETGILTLVKGVYFANSYSFFSEGLLPVTGRSGKKGYLDSNGNLVIPCQYRTARPFMCGWASVEPTKRKQQTMYIDSHGKTLKIQGFHNGKVIMGSSFNSSGEALVAYYDNDNAVINTRGEVVRKYERKENLVPIRAYDFSFDESGKNTINERPTEILYDADITPFMSGSLVGYQKVERVVVPPQFSQADRFSNGSAIVCYGNKYGIVSIVDGSFSGEFVGEDLTVSPGQQVPTYTYNLVVPQGMKPEALEVKIDVGDGVLQPVILQDGAYEFTPFINDNVDVCLMSVQVFSDGLLLWTDSLEKSVSNVSIEIGSPELVSERANEHDELRIRSVITNNSDSPVVVSGFFYANFTKDTKNKFGQKKSFRHKISPKGKQEVFTDMIVIEEESVKVSVSVKVNQKPYGTKSTVIQLKPFY